MPWPKGVKQSVEHRTKISEANRGKHRDRLASYKAGFKKGNQIRSPWTEERRRNIGRALTKRVQNTCDICKSVFETRPCERRRFCSQACFHVWNKGENVYAWKGGISSLAEQIKSTGAYKQWRTKIFKRDRYCCVFCKEPRPGKLQADHIIPRAVLMKQYRIKTVEDALACEAFWDIDNGRTLCVDCHKTTPTYGWRMKYYAGEPLAHERV